MTKAETLTDDIMNVISTYVTEYNQPILEREIQKVIEKTLTTKEETK